MSAVPGPTRANSTASTPPAPRDGFAKWAAHALLATDLVSAFSVESAR